ncbi:unnamed protein product [Prunus armeniaca]
MGLLLSPFTSPRIICPQPDPQPSTLRLRPSAFGPQPSAISLRHSSSSPWFGAVCGKRHEGLCRSPSRVPSAPYNKVPLSTPTIGPQPSTFGNLASFGAYDVFTSPQ